MSRFNIIILRPSALPIVVQDVHAAVIIETIRLGSAFLVSREVRGIRIIVVLSFREEIFAHHKVVIGRHLL